jgi:hypothetical protein
MSAVLVTTVSVPQKLNMTEGWRKEQSCLFCQGDNRNKCYNPK